MPAKSTHLARAGRGRPKKYGRPSHPVTVTLPEDVVARLRAHDTDLGRAIVALVENRRDTARHIVQSAELTAYGKHAVIVVDPAAALKHVPGVELVPIGNGRALISLDSPNSLSRFELDVRDTMEADDIGDGDRALLAQITSILRQARRSRGVAIKERSIIVLESKRARRKP